MAAGAGRSERPRPARSRRGLGPSERPAAGCPPNARRCPQTNDRLQPLGAPGLAEVSYPVDRRARYARAARRFSSAAARRAGVSSSLSSSRRQTLRRLPRGVGTAPRGIGWRPQNPLTKARMSGVLSSSCPTSGGSGSCAGSRAGSKTGSVGFSWWRLGFASGDCTCPGSKCTCPGTKWFFS
jgi:hypothetical protein